MAASSSSTPSFGLALVRIAVGGLLLFEAQRLLRAGIGTWIVEDTAYRIADAPEWYARFGQEVVLRFPAPIAWLVFGGTLLGGIAFFIGALVRPAAFGVMFMMLNVFFAGPALRREEALLVAACAFACFVSKAGRRFGLDEQLDARLPSVLTWSR